MHVAVINIIRTYSIQEIAQFQRHRTGHVLAHQATEARGNTQGGSKLASSVSLTVKPVAHGEIKMK